MARSFLHFLDHNTHTVFNLFTFSFPILLISIFLTWAASSSSLPSSPSSSSATAASNFLSPRGYSLFASALLSPSFNATGTVLAPPDFAILLAAKTYLHAPPRASLSLLLYHTLNVPLTYQQVLSIADNSELHTLSGDNCLFLYKKSNGDVTIAVNKKRSLSVKIRQPDLYVDDHLTVHGIDGVLDPNSASTCSGIHHPKVRVKAHVDRIFLDHSIRALKRRGFTVVGTAMAINRRDLMELNGITVFAVSDASLFSVSDGFRYDFSHHVVKKRMRLTEISRVPLGTVMETMNPNKTIVFGESDGRVTINGVQINVTEVYHNRWIVVISALGSLDDVVGSSDAIVDQAPSPAPEISSSDEVQSFSPDQSSDSVPSPAPIYYTEEENVAVVDSAPVNSVPFSSTDESALDPGSSLPAASPDEFTARCLSEIADGGDSAVFLAVEGEDLFCPVHVRRKLEASNSDDVAPSVPSDLERSPKEIQSDPLITLEVLSESKGNDEEKKESKREDQFMADDLFFYT
ncbi:Fasciclin-like arabinogalactan protein [Heracleum sosnowskyi]|uniref:Fasciclin-like arabinogalactan protein n=1 Tax=Heracleum sosnowskyi TaxID=360622 RepID=A0AAD8MA42_9APIA|nr:Fasciclin-like arabinogalactan protein [Heracleum sosnowskyi]